MQLAARDIRNYKVDQIGNYDSFDVVPPQLENEEVNVSQMHCCSEQERGIRNGRVEA